MELILILVLVVAVIAFVAYPLFTSSKEKRELAADALDNLIAQRDSAYDAIRDLDFDFQMGKLSQADYEELRERYKRRAAFALQQIDAAHQNTALDRDGADAQIEDQVRRLRERRRVAATTEAPAEPRGTNGNAAHQNAAHQNAAHRNAAHRNAAHHNVAHADAIEQEVARLRAAKGRCSNCGTPFHAGDRFCSKCGNKL